MMDQRDGLIRASEEEVELSIHIALAVSRNLYLSRVVADPRKFDRKWAQEAIAYAVMRHLGRFEIFRKPTEFDLAPEMLPLFPEDRPGRG